MTPGGGSGVRRAGVPQKLQVSWVNLALDLTYFMYKIKHSSTPTPKFQFLLDETLSSWKLSNTR